MTLKKRVAMGLLASVAAPAMASANSFNIEPGAAQRTIPIFAEQADVQVLASQKALEGERTNRVSGDMSWQAALDRMVANSNLLAKISGPRTIVISRAPAKAHNPRLIETSQQVPAGQATSPRSAAPAETAPADAVGDDIIVTARRVEERLQDVPVAVTAVRGEKLEQLGVQTALDLPAAVAGLSVATGAGRSSTPLYSIRGQRAGDTVFTQDQPVTVYQDDVIISPASGSNISLFDIENVQVLKGPQGTLFGRNTTGGAVLYTSAKPTDRFGGKVTVGYANYDSYKANGFLNIPVSEALRVRGAFNYKKQGGFGKVLAGPEAGADAQGYETIAGRLSIALDPTDTFQTLTVIGYGEFKDEAGPAWRFLDTPRPFGGADFVFNYARNPDNSLRYTGLLDQAIAAQRAGRDYDFSSGNLMGQSSQIFTLSNTMSVELSDTLTLKNIFGYRHVDYWIAQDFDGTLLPILHASNALRANMYSEEVQFQGTAFDDRLDYIFGVYYFKEDGSEGTGQPYMRVGKQPLGTIAFNPAVTRMQFAQVTNESFSGFGQVNYHLSDTITFNAGLRYTTDRRKAISTAGVVVLDPATNEPAVGSCSLTDAAGVPLPATYDGCQIPASASFAEPSWLVGLDWKPDPVTLLYVVSRHSYRSGGFQSRPFDRATAQLSFKPEKVTDVEVGFKRDWQLGPSVGLRTNLAAYYQWYTDIQRNVSFATPLGVGNIIQNAAKAHIYGLEVETELRLGSIARLGVNYAYIKPTYDNFPTLAIVGGVLTAIDRTDSPFAGVPKHQINANLTVTPDVGDLGALTLTGNVYYTSKQFISEAYFDKASLLDLIPGNPVIPDDLVYAKPGYALVNARAELANISQSGFSVAVWARNLFDKRYVESSVIFQDSIGFSPGVYGMPRTYGIDVSFEF